MRCGIIREVKELTSDRVNEVCSYIKPVLGQIMFTRFLVEIYIIWIFRK